MGLKVRVVYMVSAFLWRFIRLIFSISGKRDWEVSDVRVLPAPIEYRPSTYRVMDVIIRQKAYTSLVHYSVK